MDDDDDDDDENEWRLKGLVEHGVGNFTVG